MNDNFCLFQIKNINVLTSQIEYGLPKRNCSPSSITVLTERLENVKKSLEDVEKHLKICDTDWQKHSMGTWCPGTRITCCIYYGDMKANAKKAYRKMKQASELYMHC